VYYQGQFYAPLWHDYAESTFGGDFPTPADYLDPYIADKLQQGDNWAIYPLNRYRFDSLNYFAEQPNPAAPSRLNWLGTDDRGRDVLARLLYGFQISMLFGLALTLLGTFLGVLIGAVQGYFAGRLDLWLQRILEIWGSLPELYLLLIFASIFNPSIWILFILLSLFGWMGLADYMRAEFLKNRQADFVQAARVLGVSNRAIMWRHILPNSLTPVITFLPFRISGAIVALSSLDYLGFGVPPSTPSLGELLAQGKGNLEAWWISLPTFAVFVITLILLVFIGDGLRQALDKRSL
jgi:microcin C transport system permease protein